MLLWEALTLPHNGTTVTAPATHDAPLVPRRLPYDKRCATVTKSGKRCRGKIRNGGEHCPLHDPAVVERRRMRSAGRNNTAQRRLMHLPDGYLRKLSNRAAVGNAMDRLYRELRLGIVSTEMGEVLFAILTRILDSGLVRGKNASSPSGRSRADRLRPKLAEMLTRRERTAWHRAVATAPLSVVRAHDFGRPHPPSEPTRIDEVQRPGATEAPPIALQAAS
jgi:hypothetical protein